MGMMTVAAAPSLESLSANARPSSAISSADRPIWVMCGLCGYCRSMSRPEPNARPRSLVRKLTPPGNSTLGHPFGASKRFPETLVSGSRHRLTNSWIV